LIIADPNEVYRMGVKSLLAGLDWVGVIDEAVDEGGLAELLTTARADLVLLDPGVARSMDDDIHVIERVRALAPDVKIVIVTDAPHAHIRTAIELGANGCLTKAAGGEELAAALRLVADGRHYIQGELLGPLLNGTSHDGRSRGLSTQQLTILRLLSRGLKNKQIASEFGMSVTTVKSHLRLIYSQLAVSNRAEAAAAAVRLGIVQ
jgi:DNA-binding NarL/FixJ family response regulator